MKRIVQWIMWSPRRLMSVLLVVVVAVVGGIYLVTHQGVKPLPAGPGPSPAESSASSHVPHMSPVAPTDGAGDVGGGAKDPVADEVLEPVQTYLQARENQASAGRVTASDWLVDARPALTASFYDALAAEAAAGASGSLGWEWDEYHSNGWTVEVSDLSCHPHGDVYNPAGQETALLCSYNTTLKDAENSRVQDMPSGWTDGGTALISVTQVDGWWRVSGDSTGQAG